MNRQSQPLKRKWLREVMDGQHKNLLCKKLVKKEKEWKETAREVKEKIKLLSNQIQGLTASFRLIHSLADQHWRVFFYTEACIQHKGEATNRNKCSEGSTGKQRGRKPGKRQTQKGR